MTSFATTTGTVHRGHYIYRLWRGKCKEGLQPEFLDLVVHHAGANREVAACGAQVPVVAAERLGEDFPLVAFKQRLERGVAFGDDGCLAGDIGLQRRRQVVRMDAVIGGGECCAFDAVLEFLHVARPVVAHEHVDGGRGKAHHVAPVFEIYLCDEMFCQQQDVALALRQVGERNLHDVQAVEEVFAEQLLLHHLFEVLA